MIILALLKDEKMLIEVLKITTSTVEEKSKDGTTVFVPGSKTPVLEETFSLNRETIAISGIRSFRKWNKNRSQELSIDGPITKIYLKGDGIRKTTPDMLINEDYDSFADRVKTIRLNYGEKELQGDKARSITEVE